MPRSTSIATSSDLKESHRRDDPKGRYTLVFLMAPDDEELVEQSRKLGRPGALIELTHNWDTEHYGDARHFGHLAYRGRRHLRDSASG